MTQIKKQLNPAFSKYASFINTIPDIFEKEGDTIYKGRNEIKVFNVDGTLINVKRYKEPILLNRIIYTYFRSPKAERAYKYAQIICDKGFHTPEPIAKLLIYRNGLLATSYLITKHMPNMEDFYQFGEKQLKGNETIMEDFARYTAALHKAGIYHPDYSPGNILFKITGDRSDFWLVDINRIKFEKVSIKKGCANFARLWGKEEMFLLIAQEYAKARNADIEKCKQWVLYYRRKFWKKYSLKRKIPFQM